MIHILRITGNYADEFDVFGMHSVTEEQAQFLVETEGRCFTHNKEEIYFGTNECVQLNDLHIELDTITTEEAEIVMRVLNITDLSYGLIDLTDIIEEAMESSTDS